MARPIVFLSADFFVSFCKHLSQPFEKVPSTMQYLHNLIFHKAEIFINLDAEEIKNIISLNPVDIAKIADEDGGILAGRLQNISSQNLVKSCKSEIEIFRAKNYAQFNSLIKKPNFVFLSESKAFCNEVSTEFGIVCMSKELELHEQNTRVEIKHIPAYTDIQIDSIMGAMPNSHGVIVVDPYLFTKGIFLERFLGKLISKELKVNHIITLICSDKNKDKASIENSINRIRSNSGLNIELFFNRYIHDRIVFSNSFYLTCGYGFRENYPDATEWYIPAIGIYFDQYIDRKNASTKFLKSESKKSRNYLTN